MKNVRLGPVRRVLVVCAVAAIGALGMTAAAPPGIAQATSLIACGTSPAMAAVCAEVMGTTVTKAGIAAVGTGSTAATGGTAAVVASASAPSWAAGFSAVVSAVGGGAAMLVGGMLNMFGLGETQIATDPATVLPPAALGDTTVCLAGGVECRTLRDVQVRGSLGISGRSDNLFCEVNGSSVPNQGVSGTLRQVEVTMPGNATTSISRGQIVAPVGNQNVSMSNACKTAGYTVGMLVRVPGVLYDLAKSGGGVLQFQQMQWAYGGVISNHGSVVAVGTGPAPSLVGTSRVTLQCTNGTDTVPVVQMYPYDVLPGSPITFPETKCAPGWVLDSMKVDTQTGSGSWTEVATGQNPAEVVAVPTAFPNCVSDLGQETCYLRLYDGTDWCGPGGVACPNWVTQEQMTPDRFKCQYGPYPVPLTDCSAYRKPSEGVQPNRDDEGVPVPITAPTLPAGDVQPLRDPATGTTLPDWLSVTNPSGSPSTQQQTGICFPTGWGVLNPVEWVVLPVQCALQWAFVPRTTVMQTKLATIVTAWQLTPVGGIIAFVGDLRTSPPELHGCQGPHLNLTLPQLLPLPGTNGEPIVLDDYPLSACEEPVATLATWARVIGGAVMVWLAATGVVRHISGIVNARGLS